MVGENAAVQRQLTVLRLADAALGAARLGNPQQFEEALETIKPGAVIIARALAICSAQQPYTSYAATRLMLEARLQVVLTEEHVEAQRQMGSALNWMTGALVALTVVIVLLTGALAWFAYVEHASHARADSNAHWIPR